MFILVNSFSEKPKIWSPNFQTVPLYFTHTILVSFPWFGSVLPVLAYPNCELNLSII